MSTRPVLGVLRLDDLVRHARDRPFDLGGRHEHASPSDRGRHQANVRHAAVGFFASETGRLFARGSPACASASGGPAPRPASPPVWFMDRIDKLDRVLRYAAGRGRPPLAEGRVSLEDLTGPGFQGGSAALLRRPGPPRADATTRPADFGRVLHVWIGASSLPCFSYPGLARGFPWLARRVRDRVLHRDLPRQPRRFVSPRLLGSHPVLTLGLSRSTRRLPCAGVGYFISLTAFLLSKRSPPRALRMHESIQTRRRPKNIRS